MNRRRLLTMLGLAPAVAVRPASAALPSGSVISAMPGYLPVSGDCGYDTFYDAVPPRPFREIAHKPLHVGIRRSVEFADGTIRELTVDDTVWVTVEQVDVSAPVLTSLTCPPMTEGDGI